MVPKKNICSDIGEDGGMHQGIGIRRAKISGEMHHHSADILPDTEQSSSLQVHFSQKSLPETLR